MTSYLFLESSEFIIVWSVYILSFKILYKDKSGFNTLFNCISPVTCSTVPSLFTFQNSSLVFAGKFEASYTFNKI